MSLIENQKVEHDLMSSVVSPFVKFHKSSGRNVLKQTINFSSQSDTQFTGSFYPPSSSTVIDKRMLLQAGVTVTTSAANSLLEGAPRFWPLASVMRSCTISINGNSTTSQPQELVYFLQRFNNDSLFRAKYWSLTPSQPDPCSSYSKCPRYLEDTNFPVNPTQAETTSGGGTLVPSVWVRIPMYSPVQWSPFVSEPYFKSDHECSRASFPYTTNGGNTVNTYTFTEPILHGLCSDNEIEGLSNVRELGISIQWDTNLLRMFSKPTAIAGGAVSFVVNSAKLLVSYFEPEDASQIPLQIALPYTQHIIKNTTIGTLAHASTTQTFNNIVLGQVPSRLYVYVRPKNSEWGTTVADGFASISSLNFTIGNRSGILASASAQQLYQMSVANGLCMNWSEYSHRVGSIVCVDIANDIGGLTPGSLGNLSISFTCQVSNTIFTDALIDDPANIFTGQFDLVFVAELDGVYNIAQDSANLSLGLSVSDMIEAESTEPIDVSGVEKASGMMTGGSVKGNFRKFYRGLKKAVRSVNRFTQKVAALPGMDGNIYLQGSAKILEQANNMMSPAKAQAQVKQEMLQQVADGPLGSGYRGRGLLRM